jgi:hypothetical protein
LTPGAVDVSTVIVGQVGARSEGQRNPPIRVWIDVELIQTPGAPLMTLIEKFEAS